jgi:biopolymer transport protein ExbD
MRVYAPRKAAIMKKLTIGIIAVSLMIIAAIMSYRLWIDYKQSKEAENALTNIEAYKPQRSIAEVPSNTHDSTSDSLLVSVNDQGQVKLNGKDAGKIDKTEELLSKLTQLLIVRSNKTVLLKVPSAMKYTEVEKLIEEIKKVGGGPVGLQVSES